MKIKLKDKDNPIKQLLVLLDSKDELSSLQAKRLEDLSRALSSQIHVLCIDFEEEMVKEQIEGKFSSKIHITNINDVPMEYATSTYIQANNIDILVMVGQMESFVDRLKGNTGKTRVSKLYQLPILLIRE